MINLKCILSTNNILIFHFKHHTLGMNPENKGWAIGNTPELACAHNSHAIPQARKKTDKNAGVSTGRFTGIEKKHLLL